MKKLLLCSMLSTSAICGAAFGAASDPQPSAFDCAQPQIPLYSTSTEGLRRVEKRIDAWTRCAGVYLDKNDSAAARDQVRQAARQVGARQQEWMAATARYNNGQAAGGIALTLMERDHAEWYMSTVSATRSYRYVAPLPAETRIVPLASEGG
jgi:hypothetical protein